jgi:hypothetical protein
MKQLNVTELDFDQIATNLKAFFKRADSPFKDWDFSGSGLSLLIDVLAYNTHYNAMLAHIAVNESFLGSAQLRKNVVARAKTLGYLPYSNSAASSIIWLQGDDISSLTEVPSGTNFTATIGGVSYNYTTFGATTRDFSVEANRYLTIYQGSRKTVQFQFDDKVPNPRFELPDADLDIKANLMTVTTKAVGSSSVTSYTRFTELADIESTTPVYFISENPNGLYQIEFGDGTLGAAPTNRDIITVTYLVTDGKDGNGATSFDLSSTLTDASGNSLDISVQNTADTGLTDQQRADRADPTLNIGIPTISTGGTNRETMEQIRFNAPLNFQAQDRAVTANDYKSLILANSGAKFVSVWGGEDEAQYDPAIHRGNVYICAKTEETPGYLSESDKAALRDVLDSKGVLTIQHEFVNHLTINLYYDIFVKYDPNLTSSSTNSLASDIRTTIQNFADANLQDFFSVLRHSKFLKTIDDSNQAFMHTVARLKGYFTYDYDTNDLQNYIIPGMDEIENPLSPVNVRIAGNRPIRNLLGTALNELGGFGVFGAFSVKSYQNVHVIDVGMPLDRNFEVKSSTYSIVTASANNENCFIRTQRNIEKRYRFLYVVQGGDDEITEGQGSKQLAAQLMTVTNNDGIRTMIQLPVGIVDYDLGIIILFDRSEDNAKGRFAKLYGKTNETYIDPSDNTNTEHTSDYPAELEFRFKPASDNVVARRRSIIDIDVTKSTVTVEKDAIKYLGSVGASSFDTVERIDPDFDL